MIGGEDSYEAIVFDLDGTLYRGRSPISGAVEALHRLRRHVACRFLSNNGELQSSALAKRLRAQGFTVEPGEVISSADLVLDCLRDVEPPARILALSSRQLARALSEQGHVLVDDETATVVVIGVDRHLTRERMVRGLRAALNGAMIVATNEDPMYPAEDGLRPAAGAYVGFFRGMGFEPTFLCGKPSEAAVRAALARWGISDATRCLFVGDNLRTDIAAAESVGADSALVLTGVSTPNDLTEDAARPTAILASVAELKPERLRAA